MEYEKDEDLTYLTFANHKNVKMCSFCWLMWIVSSIVIQNCDRLSQLYIEDIRLLMCKFADDDNTILIIRV